MFFIPSIRHFIINEAYIIFILLLVSNPVYYMVKNRSTNTDVDNNKEIKVIIRRLRFFDCMFMFNHYVES